MNDGDLSDPPPFSHELSSLIWPMPAEEFVASGMLTKVFFRSGDPRRLEELQGPLHAFDLRYLFAQGEEATIWKNGGRDVTRATDSALDVEALIPGTTIQTHLASKSTFGLRFVSRIARQMQLDSGFFSIFASRETSTVTHYDRNYNFTIQLLGEKTWIVHTHAPAVEAPSGNAAFCADRLASTPPYLHGTTWCEPNDDPSIYRMTPGDILYVPPGYWHATECPGLSIQLNISIEPKAWYQVIGDALLRHFEAQPEWRAPFGAPSPEEAEYYLRRLCDLVDTLTSEDIPYSTRPSSSIRLDDPVRRTLGSLLMWDASDAGVHYGTDQLRFLARGTRERWIEIIHKDMEPMLELLSKLDSPRTTREMSIELGIASSQLSDFVQRLVDVGYLTVRRR